MKTNWRDFGIGMASGIAFCFVLYFGWGLISPKRPEPINSVTAVSNASVGVDENALIAANAERPRNFIRTRYADARRRPSMAARQPFNNRACRHRRRRGRDPRAAGRRPARDAAAGG